MPTSSTARLPPLDAWKRVIENSELCARASATNAASVADVERLRRQWPADDVAAALSLVDARRRLTRKFSGAERLCADREAAEQATSEVVASWKAERFAAAGANSIEDRCSGMGGDAMSLARVAPTIAIDASDVRAWMTSVNAECATIVGDAADSALRALFLHIDPARRDEAAGRRSFDFGEHSPSATICFDLARCARGGAVKLGPGLPLPLPSALGAADSLEIEVISDCGMLVQAVCWFGALARNRGFRTATMLPHRITLSDTPSDAPTDSEFRRYLYVANSAIERAGLLGTLARRLGLRERSRGLGILTGHEEIVDPWLNGYEILAKPRPRQSDVARELSRLGAHGARVRTRGGSADADAWTKALRTGSGLELDVFLLRAGSTLEAIIARPLADPVSCST